MKLYFAGIESQSKLIEKCKPPNVLFSFASHNEDCIKYALSADCKSYLLDSGAFSFMNGKKRVDFDSYTDRYIGGKTHSVEKEGCLFAPLLLRFVTVL